mmetsp:Transcript_1919/g.1828  ORF Transcript_1919/g.1828 Transcript_1919/m.1828 type:complete len:233 (+) Transcript_1919:876-1574(+)
MSVADLCDDSCVVSFHSKGELSHLEDHSRLESDLFIPEELVENARLFVIVNVILYHRIRLHEEGPILLVDVDIQVFEPSFLNRVPLVVVKHQGVVEVFSQITVSYDLQSIDFIDLVIIYQAVSELQDQLSPLLYHLLKHFEGLVLLQLFDRIHEMQLVSLSLDESLDLLIGQTQQLLNLRYLQHFDESVSIVHLVALDPTLNIPQRLISKSKAKTNLPDLELSRIIVVLVEV